MAIVLFVTNGASDEAQTRAALILTGWAHTVTIQTATAINADPTLLEGQDVLWISNIILGSATNETEVLAGHILDLFDGTGHGSPETPGLILGSPNASGFTDGEVVTNSMAVELGVLAAEQRHLTAQISGNVAGQMVTLADDWADLPLSNGFSPDILDEETDLQVGADTTFGKHFTETQLVTAYTRMPNESNPFAGKVFTRMFRDKPNTDAQGNITGPGQINGIAVETGDTLFGKRPTVTADSRIVWLGWWGGLSSSSAQLSGFAAQFAHAAITWAAEDFTETFPTTGNQRSFLFGIDADGLGLFQASSVAWTETLPAGTSVTVETTTVESGVVGAFATTINGGAINGFSASENLTNKQALVRVTLATTNSANTPLFTDLKVTIRGDAATVTATPTDYFLGGHLTWTSGENEGLAQEIKDYDPSIQRLTLTVPARKTIAVCDEFELLPGCLKRALQDCRDKFANIVNFRGFLHVPGKDRLLDYPDAN